MAAYVPRISSGMSGCRIVSPLTWASYMSVSLYGVRGGRSPLQSKKGLTTTPLNMSAAESDVSRVSGSSKSYE